MLRSRTRSMVRIGVWGLLGIGCIYMLPPDSFATVRWMLDGWMIGTICFWSAIELSAYRSDLRVLLGRPVPRDLPERDPAWGVLFSGGWLGALYEVVLLLIVLRTATSSQAFFIRSAVSLGISILIVAWEVQYRSKVYIYRDVYPSDEQSIAVDASAGGA